MSIKYSPHWYVDEGIFKDKKKHAATRDPMIVQYKSEFEDPKLTPCCKKEISKICGHDPTLVGFVGDST
jgi:hypothetical protein